MQENSATLDCILAMCFCFYLPFILNTDHLNVMRHLLLRSWSIPAAYSSPNTSAYHNTIIRAMEMIRFIVIRNRTGNNLPFFSLGETRGRFCHESSQFCLAIYKAFHFPPYFIWILPPLHSRAWTEHYWTGPEVSGSRGNQVSFFSLHCASWTSL